MYTDRALEHSARLPRVPSVGDRGGCRPSFTWKKTRWSQKYDGAEYERYRELLQAPTPRDGMKEELSRSQQRCEYRGEKLTSSGRKKNAEVL